MQSQTLLTHYWVIIHYLIIYRLKGLPEFWVKLRFKFPSSEKYCCFKLTQLRCWFVFCSKWKLQRYKFALLSFEQFLIRCIGGLAALRSSQWWLVEVFEKYFRIEDGGVDSIFFSFSSGLLMYVSGEIEQLGDRCSTELGCVCSLCIKSQFQEHWNLISQLDLE